MGVWCRSMCWQRSQRSYERWSWLCTWCRAGGHGSQTFAWRSRGLAHCWRPDSRTHCSSDWGRHVTLSGQMMQYITSTLSQMMIWDSFHQTRRGGWGLSRWCWGLGGQCELGQQAECPGWCSSLSQSASLPPDCWLPACTPHTQSHTLQRNDS